MFFPMRLDRMHRISTTLVAVVLPLILLAQGLLMPHVIPRGVRWLGFFAVVPALLIAWAMAPRGLLLKNGELRVLRRAWMPLTIPMSDVETVEQGPSLKGAWRVLGTGGFFGSYGLFTAPEIGRFRLYATQREGTVMIARKDHLPVVVTPEDAEGFVGAMNAYRHPERHI